MALVCTIWHTVLDNTSTVVQVQGNSRKLKSSCPCVCLDVCCTVGIATTLWGDASTGVTFLCQEEDADDSLYEIELPAWFLSENNFGANSGDTISTGNMLVCVTSAIVEAEVGEMPVITIAASTSLEVAGTTQSSTLDEDAAEKLSFWTAERIRDAEGVILDNELSLLGVADQPALGSIWGQGGDVALAAGRLYIQVSASSAKVCSGTAVIDSTSGRSIVITAAHCLAPAHYTPDKTFVSNLVFIPNQQDTTSSATDRNCANDPFGCWVVNFGVAHEEYMSHVWPSNQRYDYAFLVIKDVGRHQGGQVGVPEALDMAVPALSVSFEDPGCQIGTCFGYPAESDPDLVYCTSSIQVVTSSQRNGDVFYMNECVMRGGSSGGPCICTDRNGKNNIFSVVSSSVYRPIMFEQSTQCLFEFAKMTGFDEFETKSNREGDGFAVSSKECCETLELGCVEGTNERRICVENVSRDVICHCRMGYTLTSYISNLPVCDPVTGPTSPLTMTPTTLPTSNPTGRPTTLSPVTMATSTPTQLPTVPPTPNPTIIPRTNPPTPSPTPLTTPPPTNSPTVPPTPLPISPPTPSPTSQPTQFPTPAPTHQPTQAPTLPNTPQPTPQPTLQPTQAPTHQPTPFPTVPKTLSPTPVPSPLPTIPKTLPPTPLPSPLPTVPKTSPPTPSPSPLPTIQQTPKPVDPAVQLICDWLGFISIDDCLATSQYRGKAMVLGSTIMPTEIGLMTHLTSININNKELQGSIPTQLGKLSMLTAVYFYGNSLSSTVPSELGQLTSLSVLNVGANNLVGTIPRQVAGQLTNLKEFQFYTNSFTGTLPTEIGQISTLQWLGIHRNRLSGPIPSEIGRLTNLEYIYFFGNRFSGEVPSEITSLVNAEQLYLNGNELSGTISSSICSFVIPRIDCLEIDCSCCSNSAGQLCGQ